MEGCIFQIEYQVLVEMFSKITFGVGILSIGWSKWVMYKGRHRRESKNKKQETRNKTV